MPKNRKTARLPFMPKGLPVRKLTARRPSRAFLIGLTAAAAMVMAGCGGGHSSSGGSSGGGGSDTASIISDILSGQHTTLAPPTATGGNQGTTYHIRNSTGHTINIYLSGPSSQSGSLSDGASTDLRLNPGTYDEAVTVPKTDIEPFAARGEVFAANTRYESTFIVVTSSAVPSSAARSDGKSRQSLSIAPR